MIDYNIEVLNVGCLADSFFHLSKKDPENGFPCNLTSISGCVQGILPETAPLENKVYLRLLLGSHLANFLRRKLESGYGYTSTCGIATNKLLSKLVGSRNKPRNQTTLLAIHDDDVFQFVDGHKTRQIPGLGSKTVAQLESHVLGKRVEPESQFTSALSVADLRFHPTMSPELLETLLANPGAEKGIGTKVWGLLHGVDTTEVKVASDVPSQISIEDTYKGLDTLPQITEELHKLSCSLMRRMRIDLLALDPHARVPGAQRWIARPKTLRLSVRCWPARQGHGIGRDFTRISRSGPLPTFVFNDSEDIDGMAQQLVAETLLPLLKRLHEDHGQKWNLQLINVCVANMVACAADESQGVGRDISVMFRKQDEILQPYRLAPVADNNFDASLVSEESGWQSGCEDEDENHSTCPTCGHRLPDFAMAAHTRYHKMVG